MPARWSPPPARARAPGAPGDIPGLDPYVRWVEHTAWRGMALDAGWPSDDPDRLVQIMARADDEKALDGLIAGAYGGPALLVAPLYAAPVPGSGGRRALHFTAWVRRGDMGLLRTTPLPMRWELSQPLRDADAGAHGSARGIFGASRSAAAFAATNVVAQAVRKAGMPSPAAPLPRAIAVIDDGCPFLNTAFAPAHRVPGTRVARLWDQGGSVPAKPDAGWPWLAHAAPLYGREIPPDRLQAIAAANPGVDESAIYRGIDHLIDRDDARRRTWYSTHGGHVLAMAAAGTDPLTGQPDAAGEAPIVFVQLPSPTAADSSGASLDSHVLDALRWILAQCEPVAPLVVVLSYGSQAGPHDGHSLIEDALDELLELREGNFAIVLAAGNSRERGCHARRIARPERSAQLRCDIAPRDTTDTFVEAWYTPPPAGWRLTVRARAPGQPWSDALPPGDERTLVDEASQDVVTLLRHEPDPPNGRGLAMVLLALAPTQAPADVARASVDAGLWEIEFQLERDGVAPGSADPEVVIDAWIERDDPGRQGVGVAHRFHDQLAGDERNTFSSLATGRHTVVVGGMRRSDRRRTGYSPSGPQRSGSSALPLVLAVCEDDDTSPDVLACAVRSGDPYRMNGTSVAAPVVARRLFNAMAARDDAGEPPLRRRDWGRVLRQVAAAPDGAVRVAGPEDD